MAMIQFKIAPAANTGNFVPFTTDKSITSTGLVTLTTLAAVDCVIGDFTAHADIVGTGKPWTDNKFIILGPYANHVFVNINPGHIWVRANGASATASSIRVE